MELLGEKFRSAVLYCLKRTCLERPENPVIFFAEKLREYNTAEEPLECHSDDPLKDWEPTEEENKLINQYHSQGRRLPEIAKRISPNSNLSSSIVPKTIVELREIKNIIRNCYYFQGLLDEQFDSIAEVMEEKIYMNEPIIKQGQLTDKFILIADGDCNVIQDNNIVKTLHKDDYFGEEFLIHEITSQYDLVAIDRVAVWILERKSLALIVTQKMSFIRDEIIGDFKDFELFRNLKDFTLYRILDHMTLHNCDRNELVLTNETSSNQDIYYVYKGEFEVQNDEQTRLRLGQFFGYSSWGGNIKAIMPSKYMKIDFPTVEILICEEN